MKYLKILFGAIVVTSLAYTAWGFYEVKLGENRAKAYQASFGVRV